MAAPGVTNSTTTRANVASMTAAEIRDGLQFISIMERQDMPTAEADEWPREMLGRQAFLALDDAPHA